MNFGQKMNQVEKVNLRTKILDNKVQIYYAYTSSCGVEVQNGTYVLVNDKGEKEEEGQYNHGMSEGIWKQYTSPDIYVTADYYMGRKNGKYQKFVKGKLVYEAQYYHGVLDGNMIVYDEEGKILTKTLYANGVVVEDAKPEKEVKEDIKPEK